MSMRSVTSLRAVRTNLSAWAFARGVRGGILQTVMPASASTASKAAVNCPARSRMRTLNCSARSPRSMSKIPGLLDGPGPIRVGGDAEVVHVAAADLEHEGHVQALQG